MRSFTIALAAALALFDVTIAYEITSEAELYGQSPPVYPSPNGTGIGDWASAYSKAAAFVAQLTNEELTNLTLGYTVSNGCSGGIAPIERLGFPGLCLNDAGNGVRGTDGVNGYPSGVHVGASWNKALAFQRAVAMGGEFRTKGVNVALGPVVGPLGRIARGGRNWEGFSNDPYLCGQLAYETVSGIQSTGVISSLKHFIAYEQETNRTAGSLNAEGQAVASISSNLDDKTMHELYMWPFADGVRAGSGNIMCSYNQINNSYACQNSKALNGLLKTELGFQGFVVSDWYAQHGGVAPALAGLDMVMPSSAYGNDIYIDAIENGTMAQSRLDDMATRIMAAYYQMGQDSGYPAPGSGMPADLFAPHVLVDAKKASSKAVLLEGAVEGHVLVKNTNNALPFKNPKLLSIYGYDAVAPRVNDPGLATGTTETEIFAADGWAFSYESSNISLIIDDFLGYYTDMTFPQIAPGGTIVSGGGSGGNSPAYINAPYDALVQSAYTNDFSLLWDFESQNPTVDGASDACLVFINAWSSEGVDRSGIDDTYSDDLVLNVAAQCSNTIVIIHNAGIRLVDAFYDNPNVTAILYAHLPGQDSGRALNRILFGTSAPTGKLPYTVAKNESDYGALLGPCRAEGAYLLFPQCNFTEGSLIDYRAFDAANITPRFEFGFGLTYTTFAYSSLSTSVLSNASTPAYPPTAEILPGGIASLYDTIATVSATVTNNGTSDGTEVAQLYLGIPGGPVRQLRGFEKVAIAKGAGVDITFELTRKDMSVWDTVAQQWLLQSGEYAVYVGSSSRILPLDGSIVISN